MMRAGIEYLIKINMAGGRPTVMTPEVIAKLEEGFTMGFSDAECCLYANISKDSLYRHIKKHPEFSDRKEILKNHPKILAKRNIYNSLVEGKVSDSQWYAERKMKKEFSTRVEQDITSNDKELTTLTKDEEETIDNALQGL